MNATCSVKETATKYVEAVGGTQFTMVNILRMFEYEFSSFPSCIYILHPIDLRAFHTCWLKGKTVLKKFNITTYAIT
jgi:hypothetical protein